MHYNQTYVRENRHQIAERIRAGLPGTPVFTSSAAEDDRRYDEQRKRSEA